MGKVEVSVTGMGWGGDVGVGWGGGGVVLSYWFIHKQTDHVGLSTLKIMLSKLEPAGL